MFARGFPPFCTGIIAYARKTEVRRLLEHAGARLIGQLNRNDATDASIAVRQTEQEMMWFELALGPRSKQPRLLMLPEEYYCPAVTGSRQALVYSEQLAARKSPFWGVVGHTREKGVAKHTLETKMATITNDRYLSGGSKDCHATHLHLSNYRLKVFNITDCFSGRRAHQVQWALFRMDRELFCWQRAHRGVLPPCQILGAKKLVYPEDAFISCSIGLDPPSSKLHTSRSGCSVAPHLQHNKQVNCKLSTISRSLAVAAERVACIRSRSARSLTRAWHASERDQRHRASREKGAVHRQTIRL